MYWLWIITASAFAALAWAAGVGWNARRRRRAYEFVARVWQSAPAAERLSALEGALTKVEAQPRAPFAAAPLWYLIGCAHLQARRYRPAARAFGMAHHADWRLRTAALLTFACLKAGDGSEGELAEQIIQTSREMKIERQDETWEDQRMLICVSGGSDMQRLPLLERLIQLTRADTELRMAN